MLRLVAGGVTALIDTDLGGICAASKPPPAPSTRKGYGACQCIIDDGTCERFPCRGCTNPRNMERRPGTPPPTAPRNIVTCVLTNTWPSKTVGTPHCDVAGNHTEKAIDANLRRQRKMHGFDKLELGNGNALSTRSTDACVRRSGLTRTTDQAHAVLLGEATRKQK